MLEAAKGFRRLKAHKQLPILRAALAAHQASHSINPDLEQKAFNYQSFPDQRRNS